MFTLVMQLRISAYLPYKKITIESMQPKFLPVLSHSACFSRQCLQDKRLSLFWPPFFLLDFFGKQPSSGSATCTRNGGLIFNQNV
jgi:hypothetical protein